MMKHRFRIARTLNILLDSLLLVIAIAITLVLRRALGVYEVISFRDLILNNGWVIILLVVIWDLLIVRYGMYPTNRLRKLVDMVSILFKVTASGVLATLFIVFMLKVDNLGRFAILFFGMISFIFLFLKEIIVRGVLVERRRKGLGLRNVLLVGDNIYFEKLLAKLKENPFLGLNVYGFYSLDDVKTVNKNDEIRIFEKERDFKLVLTNNPIDCVVFAVGKDKVFQIEELMLVSEQVGKEIWVIADFFELLFAQREVDSLEGIPLLVFNTTPPHSWAIICKRIIDIFGSIALMILFTPVVIIASVGIKLTSKGAVIFSQKRVGLHGRRFIFYKFRSMVNDAEQRRKELMLKNAMTGAAFKMENDPRITTWGKMLRKTSMDELPQLWNVLRGEMSLVGPRPLPVVDLPKYKQWQRRRLSVKPGLTCLWQIMGRNEISDFDKWVELDLKYIDSWSLWLDMGILFKTVFVVIGGKGAK